MVLDWLRGLLAGRGADEPSEEAGEPSEEAGEPVEYKGFTILPTPRRQGGQWQTAGIIRKTTAEGDKEHRFIRVDAHASREEAESFSVTKAQQIIDEQGERIFGTQGR